MKKVLVLMATYNGERYLQQQLDSLYRQKGVKISVLVRDDGSIDETLEILRQNAEDHDIRVYSGKHLNVARGYLDLMKKAEKYDSDYYAFCDQDDVWDDDKLLQAVNSLNGIDVSALYYCGQRLVDSNLKLIDDHSLNETRSLHTRFVLSDFAGCTGVFNRKLLEEVNKYNPSYILMHDTWILKVCLAIGGKVIIDPKPHMSYRQHGGNTVGLGRSLPAYLRQVRQYMNEYKVEPQMKELLNGYGKEIVPYYKKIAEACCTYKKNKEAKRFLLDKKNIDFCSTGLNLTYRVKVCTNKL